MSWGEYFASTWVVWVSAFCVLTIYSYLLKDNPVYRVMIQVFIGINAGYFVVVQWKDVLYPRWWLPMMDGFDAVFRDGQGSPWGVLWALVGLLGLLWYFQLSKRYVWLSRIVIGITIGIGAGLTFKSQLGQNLPQVVDSFKPLVPQAVGVQPRQLFERPGSELPSLIVGRVVYQVEGDQLAVYETLHGVEVSRVPLIHPASGPPQSAGDHVGIPHAEHPQTYFAKPMVGVPGQPAREFPRVQVDGYAVEAEFRFEDGRLQAVHRETAVPLWESPAQGRFLGVVGDLVFTGEGDQVELFDLNTGDPVVTLDASYEVTGTPELARFRNPQFDRGVLLVPTQVGVAALSIRENVAPNIPIGSLLWFATTPNTVLSVQTDKNVAYVTTSDRSVMWQIPRPTPRLRASDYFNNWVFTLTLLCVMSYFLFSFKTQGKVVQASGKAGRWMLMIGFGAFFGNTVMTRMTYLLDRLMFLVDEWLRPFIEVVMHHLHLLGR